MNLKTFAASHLATLTVGSAIALAAMSHGSVALAAGETPPITAHNCSEQTVALAYPSALYKDLLPAGFAFPAPSAVALMEIGGATCDSIGTDGKSTALLSFMQVVPPPEYMDPNVGLYAIMLDSYSSSATFTAAFAAAGFGDSMHAGTVKVTAVDHPLLHERSGTTVAGDANGQVITTTTVFGPLTTIPGARTRLFAVRDGKVVGIADGAYNDHPGLIGIGALLKFGDSTRVLPANASIATSEVGFDITITGVALPQQ